MNNQEHLLQLAENVASNAYAPYSRLKVGAAISTPTGNFYTGCNVENATYTPTNCAERTAFFKAISEGEKEFIAIAIAGGAGDSPEGQFPPCGVCRQVMREFCEDDFMLYLVDEKGYTAATLAEILPFSFSAKKHMG